MFRSMLLSKWIAAVTAVRAGTEIHPRHAGACYGLSGRLVELRLAPGVLRPFIRRHPPFIKRRLFNSW